jgi:hypothetical protein
MNRTREQTVANALDGVIESLDKHFNAFTLHRCENQFKRVIYCACMIVMFCSLAVQSLCYVHIGDKRIAVARTQLTYSEWSWNTPLSQRDINTISRLRRLEEIYLFGITVETPNTLDFLGTMTSLRSITFSMRLPHPEYVNLDWLGNLQNLEAFTGMNLGITDLSAFRGLTNLRVLGANAMPPSVSNNSQLGDISDVRYLVNLEEFHFIGNDKITDISAIGCLTELEKLSIYGVCETADFSVLFSLPNLQTLRIDGGRLTEEQVSELRGKGIHVFEWARQ